MCSTGGDDGEILLEPKPKLLSPQTTCRKCKTAKAQAVLQIKDAYCKDCFLALCNHKFRAILGKSRVFGNEAKSVVVAFSGSSSSLALLKLFADAVEEGPQHRRIMADVKILYIDEGELLESTPEERNQQRLNILQATQEFGFPLYSVPLNTKNLEPSLLTKSDAASKSITGGVSDMFKSLPDTTSKVDLLTRIRYDVLAASAVHLRASIVMLADTATSVAVKILTGVALGRGASISLETGFLDDRLTNVSFLRPMRDFTSKEVVMFNLFSGCNNPVFIPSYLTMTEADSSIQRLTEDFIVTLQNDFPSTVSTVYRTGEKFCAPNSSRSCSLCMGPLDTADKSCCALEATEYSREVSTGTKVTGECGSCNCKNKASDRLLKALCYSCRILTRNMADSNLLPEYVLERAKESLALSEMRSQIEEFLIADDE